MFSFSRNRWIAGALMASAMVSASQAAVLFTIDISNPAAVVITATDGTSAASVTTYSAFAGVTLIGFFEGAGYASGASLITVEENSSTLTASGVMNYLTTSSSSDFEGGSFTTNTNDLMLSRYGLENAIYQAGQRAFTGTVVFDMSGARHPISAVGTTGNVVTGYDANVASDHGVILGQYVIIPEPSVTWLAGLAGVSGLMVRRRRVSF